MGHSFSCCTCVPLTNWLHASKVSVVCISGLNRPFWKDGSYLGNLEFITSKILRLHESHSAA